MKFLAILYLILSTGFGASSHGELIARMQQSFKNKQYSKALALSKLYRESYLPKSAQFYSHKPLLMESFILKKLCYHKQSEQIIKLGLFYAEKYHMPTKVYKQSSENLKFMEILKGWEDFESNKKFEKDEVLWPVKDSSKLDEEFYPHLDIKVRAQC